MNFEFYLEKLHSSETFKEFKEENKDAFPCSCFFVIDSNGIDNKQHFDYYIPSVKKMVSFQLENKIEKVPVEILDKKIPEKILMNYDFNFKEIEKMIIDKMQQEKIKKDIQKMLFSLQRIDGRDFLIGTIFISGLGMLKVNIDIYEKKITDFEKKSFFDMVNVLKKKKD